MAVFVWALAMPCSAFANGSGSGTINFLLGVTSGHLLFGTTVQTGHPACATDGWAINASTPGGKLMASLLIAAQAAGRQVNVVGTGLCDVYDSRESVSYVVAN